MYRIHGEMVCQCGNLPCRFSIDGTTNDAAKGCHASVDHVFQELALLISRSKLPGPLLKTLTLSLSDENPFPSEVDTPLFVEPKKRRYTKHSKPKVKGSRWDCGKGTD